MDPSFEVCEIRPYCRVPVSVFVLDVTMYVSINVGFEICLCRVSMFLCFYVSMFMVGASIELRSLVVTDCCKRGIMLDS